MLLDKSTRKFIGFDEVWSRIVPRSPLGRVVKRQQRAFLPSQTLELKQHYEALGTVIGGLKDHCQEVNQLKGLLAKCKDIQGIVEKSKNTILDEIDLFEIKNFLYNLQQLCILSQRLGWQSIFPQNFDPFHHLWFQLNRGQNSVTSFYISDSYSPLLQQIRSEVANLTQRLLQTRARVRQEFQQLLGRVIDDQVTISKNDTCLAAKLKADPRLRLVREGFASLTFEVVKSDQEIRIASHLESLKRKETEEKLRVRQQLTEAVRSVRSVLWQALWRVGRLDLLVAQAELAVKWQCTCPQLTAENVLSINRGVHPLVRERLVEQGLEFTPISISLAAGPSLITGANMGGKTVTLKMIGLLTAMAQHGLYVPADRLEFSPREFISCTAVSDSVATGLSKFGQELRSLKISLERKDCCGLILVDEIAHGTNPEEGAALAQAVVEYLGDAQVITVLTTHFAGLAENVNVPHWQVKGLDYDKLAQVGSLQEALAMLNQCMDYRLERVERGKTVPRDAIRIAEVLGLDRIIISRARNLLRGGNTDYGK